MTYEGMEFTCTKDGNMYADCLHSIASGNAGVSLNYASAADSNVRTIHIDENQAAQSLLLGLPDIASEGYLNSTFDSTTINALISNGYTGYNVVYHITYYTVNKAGVVTMDTKVLHFKDLRSQSALHSATVAEMSAINLGSSFQIPEFELYELTRGNARATRIEDYTLVYTLDGKAVDGIDTYTSGRYNIYAKAMIDGEEVIKLVHTLDIIDRYVDVYDDDTNNYSTLIVTLGVGAMFICSMAFIVRKKIKKEEE